MHERDRFLIGGEWVLPAGAGTIDVFNPATEEVAGRVPAGDAEDVDRAVAAARAAFPGWSASSVSERVDLLQRLHNGLNARLDLVGRLVAEEVGMPLSMSTLIQACVPALVAGSYVGILAEFRFEEQVGHSLVVKEPAGVVACITPWNFPLHLAVAKVAPALAAGCTVVLKPSEVAPLTPFVLAEVLEEAGVPPGVFNLVTGYGPVVGQALVDHVDVDMISFTGSTANGRLVAERAARSVKRVALELGGKSASVVLDDADLAEAVQATVSQAYLNSGQTCIAWSRLLVPRHLHDEAAEQAAEVARSFIVGDPFDPATRMGPLVSPAQQERVRAHIRSGIDEGATLVTGGLRQPEGLHRGWYVEPTVFAAVESGMRIAQEEIFGPVVSIIPYDGEDEAVQIANDTAYGLHGAVFSADRERARRVARRMRTGQVDVNGAGFNPLAPAGGYKQSGHGRELGTYGLEEYLEVKSIQQ